MISWLKLDKIRIRILYQAFFCLLVVSWGIPIFGHGPKGHDDMEFTALMAAKKGVELYDSLVTSGKLDESWETELTDISVLIRNNKIKKENIVEFKRSNGNPRSIYIFFTEKGEYNGSNFTGE
jgi:hypothetical protein